jgi:hypothetical protein
MGKLTDEEVKQKLGIVDFRHLKKEQIIDFVSCIPEMDKDVAMQCISQFPEFKSYAGEIVNGFYDLCNNLVKEDSVEAVVACQQTLDDLRFMLTKDNISEDMQRFIIEKIVEIDNKLVELAKEKRGFKEHILHVAGGLAAFGMAIGGAILGIKFTKK